jgi:hypothetical protein
MSPQVRSMGLTVLEDHLKQAYSNYYTAKGNAAALGVSALDTQAEAWAAKNQVDKAKVLLTIKQHEAQRQTA